MSAIFTPTNPIHIQSDWFVAQVNYFPKIGEQKVITRSQIIDNRNPEHPIQMVDDEVNVIALKCFLIFLALPFYTIGVMATHVIRCFTLIGTNLAKGEFSEAFLSLIQEVWAVAKAPIYAFAMEFYAAVGIVCPLPMRSVIAQLERDWSGSQRRDNLITAKTDDAFAEYFTNRQSKTTVFLAYCFQPVGELNNLEKVRDYTVKNPAL